MPGSPAPPPPPRSRTASERRPRAAPPPPAPPEPPAPVAALGSKVRDGKSEFKVKDVTCGKSRVGSEYVGEDAQGEFCIVNMTVKNIGTESQMFDGGDQFAFDSHGREYSADSAAAIFMGDSESFLNDINPGNYVSGSVVFDVPEGPRSGCLSCTTLRSLAA